MICLANYFLNAPINKGTSRHKREDFILLSSFNKKKSFFPYEQKSSPELPAYDTHLELLAHTFCIVDIYFCQMYSPSLFQSITFPHYCLQQAEQFCPASAQNCLLRVADKILPNIQEILAVTNHKDNNHSSPKSLEIKTSPSNQLNPAILETYKWIFLTFFYMSHISLIHCLEAHQQVAHFNINTIGQLYRARHGKWITTMSVMANAPNSDLSCQTPGPFSTAAADNHTHTVST